MVGHRSRALVVQQALAAERDQRALLRVEQGHWEAWWAWEAWEGEDFRWRLVGERVWLGAFGPLSEEAWACSTCSSSRGTSRCHSE